MIPVLLLRPFEEKGQGSKTGIISFLINDNLRDCSSGAVEPQDH